MRFSVSHTTCKYRKGRTYVTLSGKIDLSRGCNFCCCFDHCFIYICLTCFVLNRIQPLGNFLKINRLYNKRAVMQNVQILTVTFREWYPLRLTKTGSLSFFGPTMGMCVPSMRPITNGFSPWSLKKPRAIFILSCTRSGQIIYLCSIK